MKNILLICLFMFSVASLPVMAKGNHFRSYKSPKYTSSFGRTHHVRSYLRRGHLISGHRSANPRSGVHCRNNICY